MTFNTQRAEALRMSIHSLAQHLRGYPDGDAKTLLTEHLALLQEAELIYLTDAFVGEGDELSAFAERNEQFANDVGLRQADPHAELRKTWAPGQRWQWRENCLHEWRDVSGDPPWTAGYEYRRHPDDIDQPPKPWYPDDSGEWVEVPGDCLTCPVPDDTFVEYLCRRERFHQFWSTDPRIASSVSWNLHASRDGRIVAYKVVR